MNSINVFLTLVKILICPRCVEVYFWSPNNLIITRIGECGDLNIEAGYWLSKHKEFNVISRV